MTTVSGYVTVTIENVPLNIWYEYNKEAKDIENIKAYVPNDNREEYDIFEIISSAYMSAIYRAIRGDVKHG